MGPGAGYGTRAGVQSEPVPAAPATAASDGLDDVCFEADDEEEEEEDDEEVEDGTEDEAGAEVERELEYKGMTVIGREVNSDTAAAAAGE